MSSECRISQKYAHKPSAPPTAANTAAVTMLAGAEGPEVVRRQLEDAGFEVDYVEDVDGRRYGAVCVDGVRLIDNLSLEDDE